MENNKKDVKVKKTFKEIRKEFTEKHPALVKTTGSALQLLAVTLAFGGGLFIGIMEERSKSSKPAFACGDVHEDAPSDAE